MKANALRHKSLELQEALTSSNRDDYRGYKNGKKKILFGVPHFFCCHYDTVQFITYSKFENLPIIIRNKCNQIKLKNRGKKNATPRTNVEKCESADQLYLASILQIWFPTITNSILLWCFYNSSVEKNISSWSLYLVLADGIDMAIIKIVPLTTPMLHQEKE